MPSPTRNPLDLQPQSAMQVEIQAVVAPIMAAMEARLMMHFTEVLSDEPEWYSTVDAARLLGVCDKTVRNHVKSKKLKGKIVGNRYFVHKSALGQSSSFARSDALSL